MPHSDSLMKNMSRRKYTGRICELVMLNYNSLRPSAFKQKFLLVAFVKNRICSGHIYFEILV